MGTLTLQQAMQLAAQLLQAGRLAEAESVCRQVLIVEPKNDRALHLLGLVVHQAGRNQEAAELIDQAIGLNPGAAEYYSNLAHILRELGDIERSIAACRHALQLKPDLAEAHCNLGNALHALGHRTAAIESYRNAIALKPDFAMAHSNLGCVLSETGRLDDAIVAFHAALKIQGNLPQAHIGLAGVLQTIGRLDEAVEACHTALRLRPDLAEAYNCLGNVLSAKGELDQAAAAYEQAITRKPNLVPAQYNLANVLKEQGQIEQAIQWYRKAVAAGPDDSRAHSNLVYALHFDPKIDPLTIYQEHRAWNKRHAEPLKKTIRPHANLRDPNRRLRIGYISPDFRNHVVGRFMLNLLEQNDRESVEVFGYSDVARPDEMTSLLASQTDTWRSTVGASDPDLAGLIRNDGIDILVDLSAHSSCNRMPVFARKPAPVQVTYLAYPGTTGLDAIDYRLTDPWLDPVGSNDAFYSERSMYLPRTYWCYREPTGAPDPGPLPFSETSHITFGCLNNFCKVSPAALQTWTELLAALPNSRLILHCLEGSHRRGALDVFENRGVDPQRITLVKSVPQNDYFALYQKIDIGLDPFPYTGGTTTCDALWMGVPVITLAGQLAVHRGGLSILSNIGLPEFVTESPSQYIQVATTLARDLPRLNELRRNLRQRMKQSPLMNAAAFERDIENAYRTIWREYCSTIMAPA